MELDNIDNKDNIENTQIKNTQIKNSRRFYVNQVKPMLENEFAEYVDRIAVGLAGEGSDCFGYEDFMSRDHDFGTGVCLWITDEDMQVFGERLDKTYNDLIDSHPGNNLTRRLRERRGVMTIHGFYSSILGTDCDTKNCSLTENDWKNLDHSCLATAVNGEVFRDDLGEFSAFRKLLLDYYPDNIWKIRIVNEIHKFSASLQVNYARCMSRGDKVAARLCHLHGLEAAMQLYFLMKRVYPPYYKWTYRRLAEIDKDGLFSKWILQLSETDIDLSNWEGRTYSANYLNLNDQVVLLAERLAEQIAKMMMGHGLIDNTDPYLERHIDEIINN